MGAEGFVEDQPVPLSEIGLAEVPQEQARSGTKALLQGMVAPQQVSQCPAKVPSWNCPPERGWEIAPSEQGLEAAGEACLGL